MLLNGLPARSCVPQHYPTFLFPVDDPFTCLSSAFVRMELFVILPVAIHFNAAMVTSTRIELEKILSYE